MCVVENFSQGIDKHGIAAVVNIVPIVTHPVDAYDIDLVFDGTGLEEGLPGMAAAFGPVGHVDEEVVFGGDGGSGAGGGRWGGGLLPGPDGEAEVVTNEEVDPPSIDGGDKSSMAGRIMLILSGIGKSVPFVIHAVLAIGQHPYEPVVIISILLDDQTPGEDDLLPGSHLLHPDDGGAIHGFGKVGGSHAKAGAEHLGQDDQLALFLYAPDKGLEMAQVGGLVLPIKVWLYECYGK